MSPEDERRLVEAAARDPTAFTELYRKYFSRLYAYARYRLNSDAEAEDVVAEVFLKVVETIHRFRWRHDGSFAAWLFRIARNTMVDRARRENRMTVTELTAVPELHDLQPMIEDEVTQRDEFLHLHRLMAALSPRRQEVITLRFFGGLRNKDIAQVLSLDERTVAAHLSRGLDDLYQLYLHHPAENQQEIPHECVG